MNKMVWGKTIIKYVKGKNGYVFGRTNKTINCRRK